MKKGLLFTIGMLLACSQVTAQTELYFHSFDGMSINTWVMNETQTGMNYWTQNSDYAGNAAYNVPDVPAQPAGIQNGPNSTYMHITSIPNCNGFVPVSCNANYTAGDASDNYAEMLNGIQTLGEANVTFSFWYLCVGEENEAFGRVEYSVNGGATWNAAGPELYNTPDWTLLNITDPAFDNQSNLKFRFRWISTVASTGGDPALAVDDITITGEHPGGNAIVVTGPADGEYCAEESLNVQFDAPGTFNAGNVFTAELSGPNGSFSSATPIGTLTSTGGNGLLIAAMLPASANGNAYRIRVIASDPGTTGTDNGGDLVIHSLPNVTVTSDPADATICEGESISMTASGAATYSWTPTVSNPTGQTVTASPLVNTVYTVTGTSQDGCSMDAILEVSVENCATVGEQATLQFKLFPNPSSGIVYLQFENAAEVIEVTLFDLNGRKLYTASKAVDHIDMSRFEQGTYLLQVTSPATTAVQQMVRR